MEDKTHGVRSERFDLRNVFLHLFIRKRASMTWRVFVPDNSLQLSFRPVDDKIVLIEFKPSKAHTARDLVNDAALFAFDGGDRCPKEIQLRCFRTPQFRRA